MGTVEKHAPGMHYIRLVDKMCREKSESGFVLLVYNYKRGDRSWGGEERKRHLEVRGKGITRILRTKSEGRGRC